MPCGFKGQARARLSGEKSGLNRLQASGFYRLLLLCCLCIPAVADAHGVFKGLNSFYNGALHPLFVPAQMLLLAALGLLLGQQQGLKRSLLLLAVYAGGLGIGLVLSGYLPGVYDKALLLGTVLVGGLVIVSLSVPLVLCGVLLAAGGFLMGLDSAPEALTGKAKVTSLLGSGVALYFLMLYPVALAESFQQRNWQKIAIRVLASWVVASAVMALALSVAA